jgi:superfamily II DNA or RNA helicase
VIETLLETSSYIESADTSAPTEIAGVRLRAWQREALACLAESTSPNFLAVATPGAGKTTFALLAIRRALLERRVRRCVIVVPTQHLKRQWAHAAERFHLHLDPEWTAGYGALPSDVHGVVVTYQQVAASPGSLRALVHTSYAVLDEIHHAGETRSWGDGVRFAFEHAYRRLCLSGTPFRSDQSTIPFVHYDGDLARPDYEYGYGEALKDRLVVRPIYFPRIHGHMEWTAPGGVDCAATFDDDLTRDLANQRLRTALDASGEWLPSVLVQAHAQLMHLRRSHPTAGGLVIAMDQEHARGIAEIMQDRLGVMPTVATSEDPAASRKIAGFANSQAPWIIAVRMISEGVDIPRLRVGVYATNTLTELFFRQAVGRLVRWTGGTGQQAAYMLIPDDKRLRFFAAGIAEQRRHSLRKQNDDEGFGIHAMGEDDGRREAAEEDLGEDGQCSLFAAISAVALDEHGRPIDPRRVVEEDDAVGDGDAIPDFVDMSEINAQPAGSLVFERMPLAPVPLPDPEPSAAPAATSALARRRRLRELNSEVVRDVVHATGKTHAQVNALLNKKIGIKRITEASVYQLERRLTLAKTLLSAPKAIRRF